MQPSPLRGRSLLVVEDEPLIIIDIEFAFELTGAELTTTSLMEHALILVEHDGLAGAIVDHAIGDEDSSKLYERLNARGIPFVIYTAHSLPQEDCKGGILVSKPALAEDLVAIVEGMLRPPQE